MSTTCFLHIHEYFAISSLVIYYHNIYMCCEKATTNDPYPNPVHPVVLLRFYLEGSMHMFIAIQPFHSNATNLHQVIHKTGNGEVFTDVQAPGYHFCILFLAGISCGSGHTKL